MHRVVKHILLSFVLCVVTFLAVRGIDHLPYSPTPDAVTDGVSLPGGFIASLIYPEGIHTGRGSPGAAYLAFVGNVVFYMVVWFLLIRGVDAIRHRHLKTRSHTT